MTTLEISMLLIKLFVKRETRTRPKWDGFEHIEHTAKILDELMPDAIIGDPKKYLLASISVWLYHLLDERYKPDKGLVARIDDILQTAFPTIKQEGVAHIVAFLYVLKSRRWRKELDRECKIVEDAIMDADRVARMGKYGFERARQIVEHTMTNFGMQATDKTVEPRLLKYLDKDYIGLYSGLVTPEAQAIAIKYDQAGVSMYLALRERVTGVDQPGIIKYTKNGQKTTRELNRESYIESIVHGLHKMIVYGNSLNGV